MERKTWSADDERRVSLALSAARNRLTYKEKEPHGSQIVFETICAMTDIHRRMHAPTGQRPLRAQQMFYLHTEQERADALKQRMIEVAAGDPLDLIFGIVTQPGPQEMSTMESVNEVFKSCLVGDKPERDWKILHLLASPKATVRKVAKIVGVNHARVGDRKIVQCGAIWTRVQHLLPPSQMRVGRLWKLWEAA